MFKWLWNSVFWSKCSEFSQSWHSSGIDLFWLEQCSCGLKDHLVANLISDFSWLWARTKLAYKLMMNNLLWKILIFEFASVTCDLKDMFDSAWNRSIFVVSWRFEEISLAICSFRQVTSSVVNLVSSSHNHMYTETWKSSSSFSRSCESTEQPQHRENGTVYTYRQEKLVSFSDIVPQQQVLTSRNVWIIQSFSCCTLHTTWDWFMGVSSASQYCIWSASFQASCMLADVGKNTWKEYGNLW